jgi:hypothetical protein
VTAQLERPKTKEAFLKRQERRMERAVREGGGVYVYRARKPSSLIGLLRLPFRWVAIGATITTATVALLGGPWWFALLLFTLTGRHFAYVGETVSFKDRHGEHMAGGGRWKKGAASWSDLDARCVMRLPLPSKDWIVFGLRVFAAKRLLRTVETVLIFLLAPVYNEKKNTLNLRRIPRNSARRMRARRDNRRVKLNVLNFRAGHLLVLIAAAITLHVIGAF